MPDVLGFAFFKVSRESGSGGILPFEDLPPGLLITRQDQTSLFVQTRRVEVQLANVLGFGVELGIMTIEPITAEMRFEIGLGQNPLDGAATHVAVMGIPENLVSEVVESPSGVRLLMFFGLATGQIEHVQSCGGGKSSGGGRSAGHLANH